MNDQFCESFNYLIVETFRSISKVEEYTLKKAGNIDLSINELHLIEAAAKNKERGSTISEIAQALNITLASVTVAINKLEKKGYVQKIKGQNDGREVYVILTKTGTRINRLHKFFHIQMVREVSEGLTDSEKEALIKGVEKINEFFLQKLSLSEN